MTLFWTMIAIWLCFATLLPIYVLFKAMFPPGSPTPNAYPHGSCAASKRGMGGVMITVAADLNASKQRMKSRHHCCAGISTGAGELVIEGRCGDRMVIETSFLVTMGALFLGHGAEFFPIGVYSAFLRQVRNGTSRFLVAIRSSGSSVGSSSIFILAIPNSSRPLHVHPGTILSR